MRNWQFVKVPVQSWFILPALSILFANVVGAQSWQAVGPIPAITGSHQHHALEFSPAGEPYICTDDPATGQATVKRFDGANWVSVGTPLISADDASYLDLEFSPSGEPYIAYQDYSTPTSSITVQRFDGASWNLVGTAGFLGDFDQAPRLAFSSTGTPYLAAQDGPGGVISVSSFDGNSWSYYGPQGISGTSASLYGFDVDSNDSPHVLFRHSPVVSAYSQVKRFDGNNWVTLDSIPAIYNAFSMAISPTDEVYVACEETGNDQKLTVLKFDGASWSIVGSPAFSIGSAQFYSITFGLSGSPYVAYADNGVSNKTVVKKFDGASWQTIGLEGFSAGNAAFHELRISPTGVPYVVFQDVANFGATVMRFDSSVAVNEVNLKDQVLVYPNPVEDFIVVEMPLNLETYSIEIVNSLGQTLDVIEINNSPIGNIDFSGYRNGVYFLVGKNQRQQEFWRNKVVKN
jgi:hypothetical protein